MQLQLTITADTAKELNDAIQGLATNIATQKTQSVAKEVLPRIKKEEKTEIARGINAMAAVEEKGSMAQKEDSLAELVRPDPIGDEGTHTEASIRALMQEKAQDGKRAEVKALLNKIVGSEKANLNNLEPSKYEEFAKELNKL